MKIHIPKNSNLLSLFPVILMLAGCGGGGGNAAGTTNAAPVANSSAISVMVNNSTTAIFSAVDPDGDPLTYSIVSNGQLGTATIVNASAGDFTYTANGTGTDTVSFHVNDGVNTSNLATVTVNVSPPAQNLPPTANDDTYAGVIEGSVFARIASIGVLANDTDAENDPLSVILVSGPARGALSLNSDGSFIYTHDGSETTSDSFSYKANDGSSDSNIATATLVITPVSDPPVASDDAYTGISEGATFARIASIGVLANDSDIENDPLSAALVSGPANGTLTFNSDGSFIYTHDGSETTSDSFTYTASDGSSNSNTATVTLAITPVNDPPVAIDDAYTGISEGATFARIASIGVLANDTDAESDPLSATLVSGPANGTLTFNSDGSFIYTHNGSETTSDSFTYTASDGGGTSNSATVTLAITPVNDPPVANDDSDIANENTAKIIDVLNNDIDVDGTLDPTTVTITTLPVNGSTVVNVDGTVTYTPDLGFTGPATDTFQYTVDDDSGATSTTTATVTVTINTPPVPVAGCSATPQASAVAGMLSATDIETPTLLTYSLVSNGSKGTVSMATDGSYTYAPNPTGQRGTDTFTFRVDDIDGASSTGTETVIIDQKIMPLGDSITMGTKAAMVPSLGDSVGFRKPLYDSLTAGGYGFDFVGSMNYGWNLLSDSDNEGHGGWNDEQIAWGEFGVSPGPPPDLSDGVYAWLDLNPSDIVLLHIGTNGFHVEAIHVREIFDEVSRWETDNYPVTIILARIINRSTPTSLVTTFNDNVIAMAQDRISNPVPPLSPDNIIIVDHENALTYPDDMYNPLHPNDSGYAKMSNVWLYPLTASGTQTGTGSVNQTGAYSGTGILSKCP